jgi:hypothetical protein
MNADFACQKSVFTRMKELLPWIVIGVFVAVLTAVPAALVLHGESRNLNLQISLTAGKSGTLQVFFDTGRGYNEHGSTKVRYDNGTQVISAAMPLNDIKAIRIDPEPHSDELIINRLLIADDADHSYRVIPITNLVTLKDARILKANKDYIVLQTLAGDPMIESINDIPAVGKVAAILQFWCAVLLVGVIIALAGYGLQRILKSFSSSSAEVIWTISLALLLFASRFPTFTQPLLDWHEFRQTQSVLSAYWIAKDGLRLPDYPLPLFGPPWSAPLEFPLFQWGIAMLFKSGLPLDVAARGLAAFCFAAAVAVFTLAIRKAKAPLFVCACVWILAFVSPFALVYSKAALIEFAAVLAGSFFLYAVVCMSGKSPSTVLASTAVLAGSVTGLVKITTLPVFLAPISLLSCRNVFQAQHTYKDSRPLRRSNLRRILLWLAILGIPMLAGVCWSRIADSVKSGRQ